MNNVTNITVNDPRISAFLSAWHENGRAQFNRSYPNLANDPTLCYDVTERKTAKDRNKYIALDRGTSGQFLVEKATGLVWGIKAYGVPNKRWYLGTIEKMTADYIAATATFPRLAV